MSFHMALEPLAIVPSQIFSFRAIRKRTIAKNTLMEIIQKKNRLWLYSCCHPAYFIHDVVVSPTPLQIKSIERSVLFQLHSNHTGNPKGSADLLGYLKRKQ